MNLSSINQNNLSLSDQAANQILQYIQENRLHEGDRLPVETELMKRLSVSRSTVREAIRSLSSRNIVVVKRGCGTFVSNSVTDDPLGLNLIQNRKKVIHDLMGLRIMLEPPIASICAEHATNEELAELWRLHKHMEYQALHWQDHTDAYLKFHRNIAKHANNDVLMLLLPGFTKDTALYVSSSGDSFHQKNISAHGKIIRALQRRDGQASFEAMLTHLQCVQEYINDVVFKGESNANDMSGMDDSDSMSGARYKYAGSLRRSSSKKN